MSKEPIRNRYVGHRYVPLIMGEWDKKISYEGLSIVTYQGNSYTSKKRVPVGIDISNEEYWVVTGNYNAQVEEYRQEVKRMGDYVDTEVTELNKDFNEHKTEITNDLNSHKDEVNQLVSSKADKSSLELNIMDFGAVGDGVNDDTPAFKNAIETLEDGGGVIKVPKTSQNYLIKQPLDLTSNITIDGDNADIRLSGTRTLFTTTGTLSDKHDITRDSKIGDHFVEVGNGHTFKTNDYLKILSQRPATSDVGEFDQQLGHQTATNDGVYFGEIKRVSDTNSNRAYFRGGLVFQDYLTHNRNENHHMARNRATVEKINFVENVTIRGLNVYGEMGSFARFVMAKNALIENINWYDARDGELVSFRDSYFCTGRHLNVEYNRNIPPSNHYARNALKTVSSVSCGFENCKVINGTQPVDFSYTSNEGIPNTDSFLRNSLMIESSDDGVTAHGISTGVQITDNQFIGCHLNGMTVRSRDAIITGNTVSGKWGADHDGLTYGIAMYQRGAMGAVISNNKIKNFAVGIGWRDSETSRLREINSIVSNNNMSFINRGVQLRRVSGSDFLGRSNVRIENNMMSQFIGSSGRAFETYERFFHIWFVGNNIIGNNNISGGFFSRGDSFAFHIDGNSFINASRSIWFEENKSQDIIDLPSGQKYYFYGMNNYVNGTTRLDLDGGLYRTHYNVSAGLRPLDDDRVSLGFSSQRWTQIFATSGVISTSDRDYKKDIKASDLGLNFVDQLNPVTFKYKKGERTHYGLIAQEVEKTVNEMGIDTTDFAVITKDDNGYGMRYTELIPILIKSIQELNDKLK